MLTIALQISASEQPESTMCTKKFAVRKDLSLFRYDASATFSRNTLS